MPRGIDYSGAQGAVDNVNRDPETGIRYGIIHQHALGDCALDEFEQEYDACCPHCGEELPDDTQPVKDDARKDRWGIVCPSCETWFPEDEQYGDEPSRTVLDDGTYRAFVDSSGDVWVTKSPFYTRAAFCSPCAPGACSLSSPCDDGERAFCLGPEWFDDDKAPYPVYSVETGLIIPSCQDAACHDSTCDGGHEESEVKS